MRLACTLQGGDAWRTASIRLAMDFTEHRVLEALRVTEQDWNWQGRLIDSLKLVISPGLSQKLE
jgi:hypothetical protein